MRSTGNTSCMDQPAAQHQCCADLTPNMNVTLSQGVYVIACPHSTAALFGSVTGHIVYVHVIAIGLPYSCHRVLCTVVPVPVGSCVGTWFVSFKLKVSCESWDNVPCPLLFRPDRTSAARFVRSSVLSHRVTPNNNKTKHLSWLLLIASDCVRLRLVDV